MSKSCFMATLILLAFISIIKGNAASGTESENQPQSSSVKKFDPFIIVTSPVETSSNTSDSEIEQSPLLGYDLPSEFIKVVGDKWHLTTGSKHSFEVMLCPEIETSSHTVETALNIMNRDFIGPEKCLFVKDFKENEPRMCEREPELALDLSEPNDELPITCGVNDNHQLVEAQYYNCGSEKDLEEYGAEVLKSFNEGVKEPPTPTRHCYLMYEICYDFKVKKTLWTRHMPMFPKLLAHLESPYNELSNEIPIQEFSTDISNLKLPHTIFKNLKKSYESNNPNTSTIYTLVPKNHMALLYWKKSTTHMINSAPLMPEFIPLMEAINSGILQASCNLFENTRKTLQIYTQAETTVSAIRNLVTSIPLVNSAVSVFRSNTPIDLFAPNTWYKFVYHESEKSGILIVLHNTRGEIPKQKECRDDDRITCDFQSWSSTSELIPDDILNHAYCCKISEERVKSLFSIKEFELRGAFDIQKIISDVAS